jgi:uncharacterized phage protein (TIGR01671 family)
MSREIKFRAWFLDRWDSYDKETHQNIGKWKMAEVSTLHVKKNSVRLLLKHNGANDSRNVNIGPNCFIDQFTGLKTKHGVDIYEGDILGVTDERTQKKHWELEVVFGEIDFIRDAYTNCIGFYAAEIGTGHKQGIKNLLTYERCEVIGNVHQNPELLK